MKNLTKNFKPSLKTNLKQQPDSKKASFYASTTRYPEVDLEPTPSVIISNKLQAQISILHSMFGNIEWSGFLLYSIDKGSYEDPANMVITAQEIFPCDVGNSAYTEYDPGDFILDMADVTDFLSKGWKIGHIHTHHSMDCFFSGTDMAELHSNVGNYKDNFYLSLIVNKTHDVKEYCAKIAKLTTKTVYIPRFKIKGKPFGVSSKKEVAAMAHMDCLILSQIEEGWFNQIKAIKPAPVVRKNWISQSRWNTIEDTVDPWEDVLSFGQDFYDESPTSVDEAKETFFTYWLGSAIHNELPFDDFEYYSSSVETLIPKINFDEIESTLQRFSDFFITLFNRNVGSLKEWDITASDILTYSKLELINSDFYIKSNVNLVNRFISRVDYLIDLLITSK